MTGMEMYNIIKKNVGMGGSKPRAYCGMSGGAWCNAYVCYGFNQAGQKKLFYGGKKVTYCPTSIQWCRANLAEIPLYLAMPCDIVYFDWQPNGTPDHIGFVKAHRTTTSIFTHEGNTSGGKVAEKTRTLSRHCRMWVFRPHFKPTGLKKEKLTVDGDFGYKSIYNLQIALGLKPDGILGKSTVKALQKKAGASPDGAWGKKTSIKVQKMVGAKQDGAFGKSSVKALQKWINGRNYPVKPQKSVTQPKTTTPTKTPTTKKTTATTKKTAVTAKTSKAVGTATKTKTTSAQKLLAKMKELAWAYGTKKSKYAYKTGAPKAVCKKAMKKYGWADNKAEMSDCGNFVSTVVRESGVSKTFKALHGTKTPFPKSEKGFSIVLKGKKIPSGFLKAGDIVRYKKKNGNQHVLFIYGSGKVCEASHHNRFGAIVKDEKKYNNSSIAKISTVQVLRAK